MSVSTHVYSARVMPADLDLGTVDGSLTVDALGIPFASADLTVSLPDLAALEALDPRSASRVEITAARDGGSPRVFDLGIRDRAVSQKSMQASLSLASDEALADDFKPVTDDLAPLSHQTSLRGIVDYVLGTAIPGAHLEASPAHDADMTTSTDAENTARDPRAMGAFVGGGCTVATDGVWPGMIDGVPHKSVWMHTPTSSDSYAYLLGPGSMNGMNPGETWVFSATGRVHLPQGGTIHARARRLVVFMDVGGYVSAQSAAFPTDGTPARVSVEVTIPTGCREVFLRAYHGATSGEVKWSQFRFSRKSDQPGVDDTTYFWGGKPDTTAYDYSWVGDPDNSASKRRAVLDRKPELLVWKAGVSAMEFLHPLVQVNGLRLICDERRRWTLRDENYTAPGSLALRYGVNLVDGEDKISRDDDTWYDGAIVRYRWTDYTGTTQERTDTHLEPGATRVVLIEKTTPYPGPGLAAYLVRRALQRGREVTATAVADWTATAEQPVSITLAGAPIQIGATQKVTFDLSTDEMTVLTRTTDTPASAWVLIPAGEAWIDSPVGESWTEEVI